MTRSRALLLVPAALAALLVAGCSGGSGGSSPQGQAATSSAASGSSSSSPPAQATDTTAAASSSESSPLGDIPDNQVFVPFSPAGASFSVKVPEGWARTDVPNGASFTDKLNTVTVRQLGGQPEATASTVQAGVLADLAAGGNNVTLGPLETVTLPAGRAVHARYAADSAADPVTGKVTRDDVELYVFWRKGTEVLLTLSGPKGADDVDAWRMVSTSFTWR